MFDSNSNQIRIDSLIDVFNHLQSLSMKLNSISMMMNELTIVSQSSVSETASQVNYKTMTSQIAFLQT